MEHNLTAFCVLNCLLTHLLISECILLYKHLSFLQILEKSQAIIIDFGRGLLTVVDRIHKDASHKEVSRHSSFHRMKYGLHKL